MIVDLLRNDLGRVCDPGTVAVERLFELHRLPTVWQLTSTVTGRPRPGHGLADVFAALFPCGSVTGAPKLAAMTRDRRAGGRPARLVLRRVRGDPARRHGHLQRARSAPSPSASGRSPAASAAGSSPTPTRRPRWPSGGRRRASSAPRRCGPWRPCWPSTAASRGWRPTSPGWRSAAPTCGSPLDLDEVRAALQRATPASGRHRLRLVAGDGPPVVEVAPPRRPASR